MAVFGIGGGIFTKYKSERDAEKRAIEKFSPAYVFYDYEYEFEGASRKFVSDPTPNGPKWIRQLLGDDRFFARVEYLSVFDDDNAEGDIPLDIPNLEGIEGLKSLQRLRVHSTGLENIDNLSSLVQLKTLTLKKLEQSCDLKVLSSLESLRELWLSPADGTKFSLAPLEKLQALERLSVSVDWREQVRLDDVDSLATLPKLKDVSFSRCELGMGSIASDPNSSMPSLERLRLLGYSLESLGLFSRSPKLEKLKLQRCESLDLSGSTNLPKLKDLRIRQCDSLTTLDGLSKSTNMEKLELERCPKLKSIEGVEAAKNLSQLRLDKCNSLTHLGGLEGKSKLALVLIANCEGLQDLRGMKGSTGVVIFGLTNSPELRSLDGLQTEQLSEFGIHRCDELTSLEGLAAAKKLKRFSIGRCPKLKKLELPLDAKLEKVDLQGDFSRASLLRAFSRQPALTFCKLEGCKELESLDLLQDCNALKSLYVRGLTNLTRIAESDRKNAITLDRLELNGCEQLRSLEGIGNFDNVSELLFENCPRLSDVSQLSELKGISTLVFKNCPQVNDATFLRNLKNLEGVESIGFGGSFVPLESLQRLALELGVKIGWNGRPLNPSAEQTTE